MAENGTGQHRRSCCSLNHISTPEMCVHVQYVLQYLLFSLSSKQSLGVLLPMSQLRLDHRWAPLLCQVKVTFDHYRGKKIGRLHCYNYWGIKNIISVTSLLLMRQKRLYRCILNITKAKKNCIDYIIHCSDGFATLLKKFHYLH